MTKLAIPPEVAKHLDYYVYLYVDPRTGKPFYVGKGKGKRVLAHLSAKVESQKTQIIKELAAISQEPRLEILAHGLASEDTALRIEAAAIDLLGLDELTNKVTGWRSIQLGKMPLQELIFYYAAKPVEIVDPVLLIRINRLYRHAMSVEELYDATRSAWKLGQRREAAKFVLAVFEGVVREVFKVEQWHPGGATPVKSGVHGDRGPIASDRWEFTGKVASPVVRNRYHGASVAKYFPKGLQNPVMYVNC
ncbi:MAG: LEM-3-like GIY-YIG domain-containing protein [Pirellulaceae bacterium]